MDKPIIHHQFEQQARHAPHRIAVEEAGRHISYGCLDEAASGLAALLAQTGVGRDVIVGVMLPPGIRLVVALLATLKAGGVYMPLDPAFAPKKLKQMLGHSGAGYLLTSEEQLPAVQRLLAALGTDVPHLIVLDGHNEARYCRGGVTGAAGHRLPPGPPPAPAGPDPDDSSYLFYTSGSSGEAKAILGRHASLHEYITWHAREFNMGENTRVSQLAQLTFDASLKDILPVLCAGGTLCIPPPEARENIIRLVEWIGQARITILQCVPTLFRLITRALGDNPPGEDALLTLEYVLLAGEVLYARDLLNWQKVAGRRPQVVNLYGPTETTILKTFHRIRHVPANPAQVIHVGKAIGTSVVFIASGGRLCRVGEAGDIYIKSNYSTKGYYRNEALNRKAFVQNPFVKDRVDIVYRTGDIGRYLEDRSIEVLGREDDQVKINGIRVELNEIEQAVLGLAGIREALVLARQDRDHLSSLVCYYTGQPADAATLRTALAAELNAALIPSGFVHLDQFPRNANGKLDKKALPAPGPLDEPGEEAVANETEARVRSIWQEVLNVKNFGPNTSFIDAGGSSLKAIQVVSRVYKDFGVLLKIAALFEHPTLRELAKLITTSEKEGFRDITPVGERPYYNLSHMQKRLWILSQFGEQQRAYVIRKAFALDGDLSVPLLQEAFRTLVARHESLRTTFTVVGGEPQQKILPPSEVIFSVGNYRLSAAENAEDQLHRLLTEEAETGFSLDKAPLMRVKLLQVAESRFVLLLSMHHIISDAWSMQVLFREVVTLYNLYHARKEPVLAPLRVQYKDFVDWQDKQLAGGRLSAGQAYWLGQFTGELPTLLLPTDFPRPALRTASGGSVRFRLEEGTGTALQALCRQHEVSPFMAVLALVNVLLYKYTGQEDIIVGTPVAGREHKELENQIGFYANTLALRTAVNGAGSFLDLLRQVRENLLKAYAHQMYPLDKLVADLRLHRDVSRSPLFDVVVVMQNVALVGDEPAAMTGIAVSDYDTGHCTSKTDLRFSFSQSGGSLDALVEYNTDLFRQSSVTTLADRFCRLAEEVLKNPAAAINAIALTDGQPEPDNPAVEADFDFHFN